jgi:DNA mismatch repair ATPase MutS
VFLKTKDENNQFIALLRLMGSSGDLEQNVAAIYHRRSSPGKFVSTLKVFVFVFLFFFFFFEKKKSFGALLMLMEKCNDAPSSDLIKSLLARQSEQDNVKLYISSCLADLDHNVACSDPLDWMSLFVGRLDQPVPAARCVKVEGVLCSSLEQTRAGIKEQEALLAQDLKQMRLLLGLPKLEYKSVNGRECLVEIPRSNSKAMASIPDDWEADQHTKACVRYLAPFAKQHLLKLNMYREATVLLAKVRWNIFLEDFARLSGAFKHLVARLAAVDCISSLSLLAMSQGYVRPVISNQRRELHIVQGRHPTAEVNAPNFIGNDTHLDQQAVENMVVTGPNMGGKSTYIRGVALIVILAQVGSFVPAEQCTMGLFDAIFVRMGAEDCLHEGRSTFFSELLSTSSILESATERSLVVIDELGRGTSTFDGTAIAYATLRYLSDLHCLSFFVTHFPLIGSLEATHPNIGNAHVSYLGGQNKDESITFLFQGFLFVWLICLVERSCCFFQSASWARNSFLRTECCANGFW